MKFTGMKGLKIVVQLGRRSGIFLNKKSRLILSCKYSSVIQDRAKVADVSLKERIEQIPQDRYRNFSIVAHVDHGKSTLSDKLLIQTKTIPANSNRQFLDKLDVERERGITVKAQTCSMICNQKGKDYLLHLVDTPGHVDFRAEVSRSYASCEGALLLIDASQGVQAQTVANFYLAHSLGLKLIPVINKIDLDHANVDKCLDQIETMFELDRNDALMVSAKSGINIEQVLPSIIDRISPPRGNILNPLKILLVDSWFDTYLGVILLVNVIDGVITKGTKVQSAHTQVKYEVKEVGIMYPDRTSIDRLRAGQIGYIVLGMKESNEALVGDTLFQVGQVVEALPGFEEPKPMVFVGAFPTDHSDLKRLQESINHLVLNDKSVNIQKETSMALGQGWRLGFLGTLHASVFQERLLNEHGKELIVTSPTVPFKCIYRNGNERIISNPDEFPSIEERRANVLRVEEPVVDAIMAVPVEYLGQVIELCENNRGEQIDISYLSASQVLVKYRIPIAQLVEDFFGKLKGATRGYATLDYEESGYIESEIVKLQLLVNGQPVDALSRVLHSSQIQRTAREWVEKFKKYIGNQLFEVAIQAVADNKIIARQTVRAKRKDVTAKLHAADISRRKKLLDNQKQGKKNLKATGKVHISPESFKSFLSKG